MHPTFSTTLAEHHRDQLRRHADHIRLSHGGRYHGRPRRPLGTPWRPAARPAQT